MSYDDTEQHTNAADYDDDDDETSPGDRDGSKPGTHSAEWSKYAAAYRIGNHDRMRLGGVLSAAVLAAVVRRCVGVDVECRMSIQIPARINQNMSVRVRVFLYVCVCVSLWAYK